MIDIDAEFRRAMFGNQTNSTSEPSSITAEDMLADLRRIQRELGPPPPRIRFSKHVPTMGTLPGRDAHTDDMRQMAETIRAAGGDRVPVGFRIGGDVFINSMYQKKFTYMEPKP